MVTGASLLCECVKVLRRVCAHTAQRVCVCFVFAFVQYCVKAVGPTGSGLLSLFFEALLVVLVYM